MHACIYVYIHGLRKYYQNDIYNPYNAICFQNCVKTRSTFEVKLESFTSLLKEELKVLSKQGKSIF